MECIPSVYAGHIRSHDRENEFAEANAARMNAPKAHNGPYKCPACWGRGWTTRAAFSCQTCQGSGVNPEHRGR